MRRLADWLFWSEGSTRAAALLRIGLVPLLWDRFAADRLLYRAADPFDLALSIAFFVATPLLFVGLWTPFAAALNAAVALGLFIGVGHVRDLEPYRHHHVFLLVASSVLLALTPCGRSLSVDRARALQRAHGRGGAAPPERGPLHGQRLLAMLVSAVYLWATWDKLTPAFLSGQRLQHIIISRYFTSDPVPLPGFAALCLAGAIATVAIEAALAVGLWVPRVQQPLMVLGALFHGLLFVLLPVGPFSLNMVLLYLAFLDPALVHRAVDRLVGVAPPEARRPAAP